MAVVLPVVTLITGVANGGTAFQTQVAAIVAQIATVVLIFAAGVAQFTAVVADFAGIPGAAIMANFGARVAKIGPITAHFGALLQDFGTVMADVVRGLRLRHAGNEGCGGQRCKNVLSHGSLLLQEFPPCGSGPRLAQRR